MTTPKPETGCAFYHETTGERVSIIYETTREATEHFWQPSAVLRPVLITPVTLTPDPESEK